MYDYYIELLNRRLFSQRFERDNIIFSFGKKITQTNTEILFRRQKKKQIFIWPHCVDVDVDNLY